LQDKLDKDNVLDKIKRYDHFIVGLLLVSMFAGFLYGRAILSISTILLGVWGGLKIDWQQKTLKQWWLLGLVWVGYMMLSLAWSDNLKWGIERIQVKLPILLLPLAFMGLKSWSPSFLRRVWLLLNTLSLTAIVYTIWATKVSGIDWQQLYHIGHSLPVPAYKDYIRLSTCFAILIVSNVWVWHVFGKRDKIWIAICAILLLLYLHVLASRAGLLALYIGGILTLLAYYKRKHSIKYVVGLGVFALFIFVIATLVPSLPTKFNYFLHSLEVMQGNPNNMAYSDIGRQISWRAGWYLFTQEPLIGLGVGDVLDACKLYYHDLGITDYKAQELVPHNEFILLLAGTGSIGCIIFMVWCFFPLVAIRPFGRINLVKVVWAMLLGGLLFEPWLEIQQGVFVYMIWLLMAIKIQNDYLTKTKI
jgi:O-antigen ligase